jgi:hypothetical protein
VSETDVRVHESETVLRVLWTSSVLRVHEDMLMYKLLQGVRLPAVARSTQNCIEIAFTLQLQRSTVSVTAPSPRHGKTSNVAFYQRLRYPLGVAPLRWRHARQQVRQFVCTGSWVGKGRE